MSSIGEDQVDLAQTYTGLDKKISEEFISIAMDPERKSKASSSHGSEIGTAKTSWKHDIHIFKLYRVTFVINVQNSSTFTHVNVHNLVLKEESFLSFQLSTLWKFVRRKIHCMIVIVLKKPFEDFSRGSIFFFFFFLLYERTLLQVYTGTRWNFN